MFPSEVATQNPDTIGWDPLGVAVKEAHKRNIELHAWCWVFNVGNAKHNPIINKEADYPGPVSVDARIHLGAGSTEWRS